MKPTPCTKITFCKTHEGLKLNKGKILKFCKHISHESFFIHVTFHLDLNLLKLCIFLGFLCMGPKLGIGSWYMKCCWFNQINKAIILLIKKTVVIKMKPTPCRNVKDLVHQRTWKFYQFKFLNFSTRCCAFDERLWNLTIILFFAQSIAFCLLHLCIVYALSKMWTFNMT
jgi:hypothetical protein